MGSFSGYMAYSVAVDEKFKALRIDNFIKNVYRSLTETDFSNLNIREIGEGMAMWPVYYAGTLTELFISASAVILSVHGAKLVYDSIKSRKEVENIL